MQMSRPSRKGCQPPEPRTNPFVATRHRRQPLEESPQIKKSPARKDWPAAASDDVLARIGRLTRKSGGVVILAGIDNVEQVMGHPLPVGKARFGAADIEPSINLDRVVVDDLAAHCVCQTESELRFARAGRSCDHDQGLRRLF